MHRWNAEDYSKNSCIQSAASEQLLKQYHFKGDENILDIGCGDGKITAKLALKVPNGSVLGIDLSKDMISHAKKKFPQSQYPNLLFQAKNAEKLNDKDRFDIIFSSFALQWIPNHRIFFKKIYDCLKISGCLIVTVPLGMSSALEQSITEAVQSEEWAQYFIEFRQTWHFPKSNEFLSNLRINNLACLHQKTVEQTTFFPNRDALENYILPWFPYLEPIPEKLKDDFFKLIIDNYLKNISILSNKKIPFKFKRLDVLAKKINL